MLCTLLQPLLFPGIFEMKKIVLILIFIFVAVTQTGFSQEISPEAEKVIVSAEMLFKSMKGSNYPQIWECLSEYTREHMVSGIKKDALQKGIEYSPDQIRFDFTVGGLISRTYWQKYLSIFNPDMALEESKWTFRRADKKKAEIELLHKNSKHPAVLKLFKEDGEWRVGLQETFGTRSWFIDKEEIKRHQN